MVALSQRAWVGLGFGARLLMAGFLAVSMWLKQTNHVGRNNANGDSFYQLQSYTYAFLTAAVGGLAGVVLQTPIAVYLMVTRAAPSVAVLNISMYADMAASVALASGVGAAFGATNDARQIVDAWSSWDQDGTKRDLDGYFARGAVAAVFLLVGLLLSMCASVVSARFRARAGEGHLPI